VMPNRGWRTAYTDLGGEKVAILPVVGRMDGCGGVDADGVTFESGTLAVPCPWGYT